MYGEFSTQMSSKNKNGRITAVKALSLKQTFKEENVQKGINFVET